MELLKSAAQAIVKMLPTVLARHAGGTELCHLKLWYYDTSAGEYYLLASPMSVARRDALIERADKSSLSELWRLPDPTMKDFFVDDHSMGTTHLFRNIQRWRAENDATQTLRLFACRVCEMLNQINWPAHIRADPDFCVFAINGTDHGVDNYSDLMECVPPEIIKRLRQKQLLGPGKMYTDRRGFISEERWEMTMFNAGIGLHPKDTWKPT